MFHVPEKYRVQGHSSFGNNGAFFIMDKTLLHPLNIIASDGEGWEHVSVSLKNRTPVWFEMCFVKELFWDSEDTVIQYHPPKSEYVNCHPFCLHLWRPIDGQIILPPSYMVGPKE